MSERDRGALRLAERVIQLLDQGSFSATYKYAVLIAFMDLCMERTNAVGDAPDVLTTRLLAESVIALYWPQSQPYDTGEVLRQNTGGPAEILRRIVSFRERAAEGAAASPSLARARAQQPAEHERLLRFVEWKLIEMPLPRLQFIGRQEDRFLYEYNWIKGIDDEKRRVDRYQDGDGSSFDNRILLKPNVGEYLVRLNGVLRPLIYRQWAAMVARMNKLPEATLENFLFGADRVALDAVRSPLRELQGKRCFYCDDRMDDRWEVDHFIPWSRYPDNGLDNLVASHRSCNNKKSDFLAAAEHVERWRTRSLGRGADLAEIARRASWEQSPERTLSVARGIYQKLPDDTLLWRLKDEFVSFDRRRIKTALAASAASLRT